MHDSEIQTGCPLAFTHMSPSLVTVNVMSSEALCPSTRDLLVLPHLLVDPFASSSFGEGTSLACVSADGLWSHTYGAGVTSAWRAAYTQRNIFLGAGPKWKPPDVSDAGWH